MKFALVNGARQAAQPGLSGTCRSCDRAVVAKCGKVRIWHWADRGRCAGDPWWENETEWHRTWKGHFPESWQEIVQKADDGEKHIADVKTDQGWVLEFQHSRITPDERQSRDTFYGQIAWVVDGTNRKSDAAKFVRAWDNGTPVGKTLPVQRLHADDCALLREWSASAAPIFLDFGGLMLAWLLPGRFDGFVYAAQFPRDQFIHIHRSGAAQPGLDLAGLVKEPCGLVAGYESPPARPAPLQAVQILPHPNRPRVIRRSFRF